MYSANGPSTAEAPASHNAYLGKTYFTELDGLRAVSALVVVTVHLYDGAERWAWLAGERGVTVFFVLSGWLITTLALREEARRGRLSLSAFYVRRSFRILPLYYVVVALYCLSVFALPVSPHLRGVLAGATPYFLLYFQEVQFGLWGSSNAPDMVFVQSWTLGIEEKFYLLWPLLGFLLWRGNARSRIRGTALLAVLLAVLPVVLSPMGPVAHFTGRMLICYASLLSGCLLAFLLHDPAWFARLRWLGRPSATAAALLLLLAAHFATPWLDRQTSNILNIFYTLAVTALLGGILTGNGFLNHCLRWPPLVFVGRLSYGVYLIHGLCIAFVCRLLPLGGYGWPGSILTFLLACVVSVLAAWGLRFVVETPFIEWGRRWSQKILQRADRGGTQALPPAPRKSAKRQASQDAPSPQPVSAAGL